MEMKTDAGEAHSFTVDERTQFRKLVKIGDEVDRAALMANSEMAKALVFGRVDGELQGVAALKRPQASYRKRIGEKAGFALNAERYPFELGYVFLLPEARGKGNSHLLVASALECADGAAVFATARVDNGAMLSALDKAGFKQVGSDYPGRGKQVIRLFVRQPQARF